jgi:multidrug efflux pump subunit AcrB
MVMAALMMLLGTVSFFGMNRDIFPAINIPTVNEVWYYPGLSAPEMEQRIVNITERSASTTVNGIDHIESTSLNGIGIVKYYFQEGASTALAIAQLSAVANAIKNLLPPGIAPPTVLDYEATNVPIAYLVSSSDTLTDSQLYDYMFNFVGLRLFTIPGLSTPAPFGGATRQIMLNIDPSALYAKGLSPNDVVNTIQASNVIVPGGTAKIGNFEYNVIINGSPSKVDEFNRMPIKVVAGAPVYVGDVARASDSHAVQTDVALVNGKRATYRLILKHPAASTLTVINRVKSVMPLIEATAPKGTKFRLAFDQSRFVTESLIDVLQEMALAAGLVGVMTIIFLGSWRSTLIVITSIPLAIMTSIIGLKLSGQTINVMTLGGLALAVGMLVDDATVEVENIHRNHAMGKPLGVAILDGAHQIALPALVGTLSICIVFAPVLLLTGVSRYLFTPLALAVVYAMLTSYLLSRTLVATMARYLLKDEAGGHKMSGWFGRFTEGFDRSFDRLRERYRRGLTAALSRRAVVLSCVTLVVVASMLLVRIVGTDFFPYVDAGMIRLHAKVPVGTRLEESERIMAQVEGIIHQQIPNRELDLMTDHIGLPIYWALLFYQTDSLGPQDADIQIQLKEKHRPSRIYIERIREQMARELPQVKIYSQAADIISQVLSFGLSAPIDVQIAGQDIHQSLQIAQKLRAKMAMIPGVVDLRIPQVLTYPTVKVAVDRAKALELGITEANVADSMLTALSSSVVFSPNNWLDPNNGVNYSVAAQTPQHLIDSIPSLVKTPITGAAVDGAALQPQFLSNLVGVQHLVLPQGLNHLNVQRVLDIDCGVEGRDLGGVSAEVQKAIDGLGSLPPGTQIRILGESQAMRQSFLGMGQGLLLAIVLVYLLMATNFQSWLDPLIIMMAVPGALAGVLWMLIATGTTLNVESLMGTIMAVGVGVANGNLLITFANDLMEKEGADPVTAAIEAGVTRLRPVLMTALAMILGMLPMASAMGAGGEQNAPLGRAVIGGLIAATGMTLVVVPIIYSLFGAVRVSKLKRDAEVRGWWAQTEAAKEQQM